MTDAIRSEFRKLLTVRSTLYIVGFALLVAVFFAFYVEGFKASAVANLNDPNKLAGEVVSAISTLSALMAIPGILLITHEYRYNTISYTLTDSRSRTKVMLAKMFTITCFSAAFSIFLYFLSPMLAYLGTLASGHHLVPQVFPAWSLLWRSVSAAWEYSMLALMLGFIIRAQVGTIVAMFIIPSLAETLLGLLLKNSAGYLPFASIQSILTHNPTHIISYSTAALVGLAYVVVSVIIAWQLFLRRDAN
jgi:ABC-2 type transport system permease protein